jgi:hypothetical protein
MSTPSKPWAKKPHQPTCSSDVPALSGGLALSLIPRPPCRWRRHNAAAPSQAPDPIEQRPITPVDIDAVTSPIFNLCDWYQTLTAVGIANAHGGLAALIGAHVRAVRQCRDLDQQYGKHMKRRPGLLSSFPYLLQQTLECIWKNFGNGNRRSPRARKPRNSSNVQKP